MRPQLGKNCVKDTKEEEDEQVKSVENTEITFENELLHFITEEVAAGVSIFALNSLTTHDKEA